MRLPKTSFASSAPFLLHALSQLAFSRKTLRMQITASLPLPSCPPLILPAISRSRCIFLHGTRQAVSLLGSHRSSMYRATTLISLVPGTRAAERGHRGDWRGGAGKKIARRNVGDIFRRRHNERVPSSLLSRDGSPAFRGWARTRCIAMMPIPSRGSRKRPHQGRRRAAYATPVQKRAPRRGPSRQPLFSTSRVSADEFSRFARFSSPYYTFSTAVDFIRSYLSELTASEIRDLWERLLQERSGSNNGRFSGWRNIIIFRVK